jgi:hypothetical protein
MGSRKLAGMLALLAILAASAPLAPAAGADSVKHFGALTEVHVNDAGGCQRTTFFVWSELPGADSYTVNIEDTLGFFGVMTFPPYSAESEGEFGGAPPVPKGQHRLALTYQGGGVGGCQANDLERFTVKRFTANFDDDESRIVGTVADAEGLPVNDAPVSISGPKGSTVRTKSNGAYGAKVKAGTYTVRGPKGSCVVGEGGCKDSQRVEVRKDKTESVHFKSSPPGTIAGTVRLGCGGDSCIDAVVPGAEVTASPAGGQRRPLRRASATAGADGTYELEVPRQGDYEVRARFAGTTVKPGRKIVRVGGADSRAKADFKVCGVTGGGGGDAGRRRAITRGTWDSGVGSRCTTDRYVLKWVPPPRSLLTLSWKTIEVCSGADGPYAKPPRYIHRNKAFGELPNARVEQQGPKLVFSTTLVDPQPENTFLNGHLTGEGGTISARLTTGGCVAGTRLALTKK